MLSIKAAVRIGGIADFSAAVAGLRVLLEQYWDSVHPRLVLDGEDNTLLRINILRELCDRDGVLAPLRTATLVTLPVLGSFSLRDIAIATGEVAGPAQPGVTPPDMASIDAAFGNCEVPKLRGVLAALRRTAQDAEAMEAFVTGKVSAAYGLSLEPLTELIARMTSELTTRSGRRLEAAQSTVATAGSVHSAGLALDGITGSQAVLGALAAISSRADVVRVLDGVCDYYDRHEPSSPVPMLLRRAKRLVSMSFVDIVRELAPAGISEIETIRGPQEAENR
jgi:type VI secretion system protein ImpA